MNNWKDKLGFAVILGTVGVFILGLVCLICTFTQRATQRDITAAKSGVVYMNDSKSTNNTNSSSSGPRWSVVK